MPREQLKQLLGQLQNELDQTRFLDDEARAMLEELHEDIEDVLDAEKQQDDPVYATLRERLVAASARFSAQHPTLDAALREIGTMLGKIGI
ncbi:DUF4404 family protein [Undibacterium squillarum]|uniref:DUF4404 family protein n=1 Tax=Undibacterium squillarum TaxID=1131567 RepID=A0ABQ2XPH1_9BURK|nr:DUF4404 family protein [Undibacterium squillarum]GGX27867.1 hypothetical protein GCM10010946_00690 [Undibacterium squillarum]